MKKKIKIIILFFILAGLSRPVFADSFLKKISGRILLEVEKNGEAWYLYPPELRRYYLGRPEDAYRIMREKSLGIKNSDLNKIAVGILKTDEKDSDQDGLSDSLEDALGTDKYSVDSDQDGFLDKEEIKKSYNPLGSGKIKIDLNFSEKYKGRIFLQVENKGEAWYVNPKDLHRYYLGRAQDAFVIMRYLGLGISDENIKKIPLGIKEINLSSLETKLFNLVNEEREKYGLKKLNLNEDISLVAREHSINLAKEDEELSGEEKSCDFPIIHHEGLNFGLYSENRLRNRGINYFSMSGENIALMSKTSYSVSYNSQDPVRFEIENCSAIRKNLDESFKERLENNENEDEKKNIIKEELEKRKKLYAERSKVKIVNEKIKNEDELAKETVEGWMNSPGHRANILNEKYNEAGMGVAIINGYVISTEVFIKRVNCGYFESNCCQEKNYYYCYAPNQCQDGVCK